jgi:hypothetical protein
MDVSELQPSSIENPAGLRKWARARRSRIDLSGKVQVTGCWHVATS